MPRRGTRARRQVPSEPMTAEKMKMVDMSRTQWDGMSTEQKGQILSQRVE